MLKITLEEVNWILAELQNLPYANVYKVINTLTQLEKLEEPKKEDKPKK
jgi:hypothetical protein